MSLTEHQKLNQYRGHVVEADPASEPVTAAQLRDHLRTDSTAMPDAEANLLIEEARQWIEDQSGIAMITQSWRLSLDRWPSDSGDWWDGVRDGSISELSGRPAYVRLPKWPLQSVTSVTTYDLSGTGTAAVVASTFDIDLYQRPGRLALKSGSVWPVAMRDTNAVQIIYVAGYGDAAANVPAPFRRAVLQLAAYLYSHRGDACDIGDAYIASGAASIMGRYRVVQI